MPPLDFLIFQDYDQMDDGEEDSDDEDEDADEPDEEVCHVGRLSRGTNKSVT